MCVENKKAVHPKPMNHWWATDECISFEIEDFFKKKKARRKKQDESREKMWKHIEFKWPQVIVWMLMFRKKKKLSETTKSNCMKLRIKNNHDEMNPCLRVMLTQCCVLCVIWAPDFGPRNEIAVHANYVMHWMARKWETMRTP